MRRSLNGSVIGLLRSGSPLWFRDEDTPWVCVDCFSRDGGKTWVVTAVPRGGFPLGLEDDASNFELDLDHETGRFHAICWLRDHGHPGQGWMMHVPAEAVTDVDVLAWSVLSVARGGLPIVEIFKRWVPEEKCVAERHHSRTGVRHPHSMAIILPTLETHIIHGLRLSRFPSCGSFIENAMSVDEKLFALPAALANADGTLRFPPLPGEAS